MNIALIGYGKMGKAIEVVALQRGHRVILKIDYDNQHDLTPENLLLADAAIEFTGPESALENIIQCVSAGTPVVCGSTGWLQQLPHGCSSWLLKKRAVFYMPVILA